MFESLFSILKSSRQQAAARQHHFEGMTKQKSSSPPFPVAKVIYQQPMQQLHLRGGGEGADICCGVCTGLICFECCTCCLCC
ncbi:Pc21g00620 [Penicillium rubens Wisconsin 54-1255]|uniref:Pc21g00620 protein n=1 Tax=Penicillium rubens (strain ATCC 28089 / DSM 1075 / NRRL 1951 / Wisconsin 54-1255) TaxID=500485 RepID=B6HNJ4_PENRW|nr:Pc21g00620 [Penicillium rubens Wisconsin 54-1255]